MMGPCHTALPEYVFFLFTDNSSRCNVWPDFEDGVIGEGEQGHSLSNCAIYTAILTMYNSMISLP